MARMSRSSVCDRKGNQEMCKTILNKKWITVLVAVLMMIVASMNAFAALPIPPYFFMDSRLIQPTPMGNATIQDVEYDSVNGDYYLFLQPETYYSPTNLHTYIFGIDRLLVQNPQTGGFENVLHGSVAIIPEAYIQYTTDADKKPYFATDLGVSIFDLTAGTPVPMIDTLPYISVDAL
jgi:hypothetical protein